MTFRFAAGALFYAMAMIEFFVSPSGNDAASGSREAPFATFARARDAVRALKSAPNPPAGPFTITARQGVYPLKSAFELTTRDSGTPDAPVVYRAAPGERVVLTGGIQIPGLAPVTDKSVLARIDESVRGKVVQADLKALGVSDFGDYSEPTWNSTAGSRIEFFFNDKPMPVARWPNKGFAEIAGVAPESPVDEWGNKGDKSGKLFYEGNRPERWKDEKDLMLHGYWFWDWAEQRMAVAAIDTAKKTITLRNPERHCYGYRKGQRFYAYNALCELDEPGEWFVDRDTGILYFYPPEPLDNAKVVASVLAGPLVRMTEASHVVLRGFTLEAGRTDGVAVSGGAGVKITGCVFRNLGAWAVRINGGLEHGVEGCDIYETGEGGISLDGGDRKTLTAGKHSAVNNHIHHYARWKRIYRPAIALSGVGNRAAHNLIHDAPHMAMAFHGNEHLIELNEIHHVVYESNDAGAIYCGRDPSMQGTIIRHNYFHHVGKTLGHGVASVYFDDGHCGNTVFGNVFYKACLPGKSKFGAVFIHAGRYNTIENNVFVECEQAYNESPWGQERWKQFWTTPPYNARLFGDEIDVRKPPYSEKYPWLANVLDDTRPNTLIRNIVYKCGAFNDRGMQDMRGNLVEQDPLFVDAEKGNFQLKDDSPAFKLGFKRIPINRIGLIDDETPASLPAPASPPNASEHAIKR